MIDAGSSSLQDNDIKLTTIIMESLLNTGLHNFLAKCREDKFDCILGGLIGSVIQRIHFSDFYRKHLSRICNFFHGEVSLAIRSASHFSGTNSRCVEWIQKIHIQSCMK